MIEYNMRFDLQSARTLYTDIVLTAGDVLAYRLNFSFLSNNVPYDVTGHVLAVKGKRSDGQVVIDQGEVTADGEVYYEMTSSMYAVAGRLSLEVALVTPLGGYVTTKELILEVRAGHGDGDLATENTTPIIVRLMDQNIRTEQSVHKLSQEVIELAAVPAQERVLSDQSYGNAFRGTAKGEVIRMDDVSPLEHTVGCKVFRKNLFDISKIEEACDDALSTNPPVLTMKTVDNAYIEIATQNFYTGNGFISSGKKLRELCPQLVAGKTYTLSAETDSSNKYIYLTRNGDYKKWSFGMPATMTEEKLDYTVIFYGLDSGSDGTGVCKISNIQIEEGKVATTYAPYVDFSNVTLLRLGGNLISMDNITKMGAYPNTVKDNVVTLKRVSGKLFGFQCLSPLGGKSWEKNLKVGETYTFSVDSVSDHGDTTYGWCFGYKDGTTLISNNKRLSTTITLTQPITNVYFYVDNGVKVFENDVTVKNPRCEFGSAVTADDPYSCETYPVNEDGFVDGVTSVSPTMTLMADAAGTSLEVEYNRDSNKVYDRLVNAIISLGGNV